MSYRHLGEFSEHWARLRCTTLLAGHRKRLWIHRARHSRYGRNRCCSSALARYPGWGSPEGLCGKLAQNKLSSDY